MNFSELLDQSLAIILFYSGTIKKLLAIWQRTGNKFDSMDDL